MRWLRQKVMLMSCGVLAAGSAESVVRCPRDGTRAYLNLLLVGYTAVLVYFTHKSYLICFWINLASACAADGNLLTRAGVRGARDLDLTKRSSLGKKHDRKNRHTKLGILCHCALTAL